MNLYKKIQFSSFVGYRRFTRYWWNDILRYMTGLSVYSYQWSFQLYAPGWCKDIYTYWHRARYGWAPRDTFNLDGYLNQVLAGSLEYFAEHTEGCPHSYIVNNKDNFDAACSQWETDLRRWAQAFSKDPSDVYIEDNKDSSVPIYLQHSAEEQRRRNNLHQALKEIEPVWESLWE